VAKVAKAEPYIARLNAALAKAEGKIGKVPLEEVVRMRSLKRAKYAGARYAPRSMMKVLRRLINKSKGKSAGARPTA